MRLRTAAAGAALALAAALFLLPAGPDVRVEVPAGAGASETARLLKAAGVIPSAFIFKALAKATGSDHKLKPGLYVLRRRMGTLEALRWIREGRSEQVKIVIPEGFMARQIADRLQEAGVADSAAFMDYVRSNNMEGYLFPASYFFHRGLPAEEIAHHMHVNFRRFIEPEVAKAGQQRFTLAQAVTLASIVQREARLQSEMPMIAAVYINRLDKRMRLEADPTVQYALGKDSGEWKKALTRADLGLLSKYNTYQYFGLPPGPICSPGLDAVRAVLFPAQTDALYFVADRAGGHIFSRTLDEHINARNRIKRAFSRRQGW
ncbi:MAG: endolytic transglycosylase MltG [Elusimicrobia bacterium]|nr:endolytic transglycosylase MltG [Elusimicrobiota bacterium]